MTETTITAAPGKMHPGAKAAWLEALRSGDYVQGHGKLCVLNDDGTRGYCCLGVLAEVAVKSGQLSFQGEPGEDDEIPAVAYDDDYNYLPESIQAWAGLTVGNPRVEYEVEHNGDPVKAQNTLADLNDQESWGFGQIADAIEKNL